ncbi:IS5 family transposase, partial [Gluconobacter sp. P1C6_b]|uniref:IS5 family transposase n=2 Tax=Gluconobacter sp. P1C6_b TaxID=2762619 RepID=UPI0035302C61
MHARCDNQGRSLGFVLTGGQVSDYKATDALMSLSVPNPRAMLADRGYDSDSFRQDLLLYGILPIIPSRKGRSAPQKTDWRRYQDRNRIERMFNRLKQMRRIATRYDKTVLSFMSFLNLAAARLWIGSFVNTA